MANTITGAALSSSLLRSQSASIIAQKSEQQAMQAMINQLQKVADQGKQMVTAQASSSQSTSTPPRGSFVDITI